jgi:hypothetical protein
MQFSHRERPVRDAAPAPAGGSPRADTPPRTRRTTCSARPRRTPSPTPAAPPAGTPATAAASPPPPPACAHPPNDRSPRSSRAANASPGRRRARRSPPRPPAPPPGSPPSSSAACPPPPPRARARPAGPTAGPAGTAAVPSNPGSVHRPTRMAPRVTSTNASTPRTPGTVAAARSSGHGAVKPCVGPSRPSSRRPGGAARAARPAPHRTAPPLRPTGARRRGDPLRHPPRVARAAPHHQLDRRVDAGGVRSGRRIVRHEPAGPSHHATGTTTRVRSSPGGVSCGSFR